MFRFILMLLGVMFFTAASVYADGRSTSCMKLQSERSVQDADASATEYVLCVTHSNLRKFPKSIVTFAVHKIDSMSRHRLRLVAKRHLVRVGPNQYGYSRNPENPLVTFDRKAHKVFLAFGHEPGAQFSYVAAAPLLLSDRYPMSEKPAVPKDIEIE